MDDRNLTQTPEQVMAARQADLEAETEIVAALLHRAMLQHVNSPAATVGGATSGSVTHLNRQLEAILSYYVTKGDVEALVRYQSEFLRMLQLVAENVASFGPADGSGKVTVN